MLTFFRKIRKGSLEGSAITKYLIYAAGEILLVMFGILLALQVNNWNENRKSQAQEGEYFNGLYNNLVRDSVSILEAINQNQFKQREIIQLLSKKIK